MKKPLLTVFLFFSILYSFSQTKVYLVPTLHGLHKTNQQYNYDSVKAIVERTQADVIAVEIRSEEIQADTSYLRKNYPYEMWKMRYWFPSAITDGFDWLGKDLEGRAIPEGYWKDQSKIKALEGRLQKDSVYAARLNTCEKYTNERVAILKTKSLPEILKSRDAFLTREYYNCMRQQLKGSAYIPLVQFYDQRNQMMQRHLGILLKKHPNKTIVVLTGDDHYPYILDYLKKQKISISELL